MKETFSSIEKKEKEPGQTKVEVDFIRHGKSSYTEQGRDLTPEGEKQVLASAREIIEKINPTKEIVVLLSSPAARAQGSAEIITGLMEEKGIEIYKRGVVSSMRNFDQKDNKYLEGLWQDAEKAGVSADQIYAKHPKYQDMNEKFETQGEVRKRAARVFNWIRYLAEHAKKTDKTIHIIGVSHFEFLNPIMEDLFDFKVEEGKGITYGEDLRIRFDFARQSKKLAISAEFRGQKKDNIIFDKKTRKFIIEK
ncbi:MAG: phosphoglycerate mutase family protein [Patescibacteria group bacterium]